MGEYCECKDRNGWVWIYDLNSENHKKTLCRKCRKEIKKEDLNA